MMIEDPQRLAEMREAFAMRDRSQDGRFVVAVKTTGIYCRPSCPARRPKPENVTFYADCGAADAAGFRPCKRCRPGEAAHDMRAVKLAIAAMHDTAGPTTLATLAAVAGYSPGHFQRVFKRATGISPAAYARALREDRLREALADGGRVVDAVYDAGYESTSRFYASIKGKLGMAPSVWSKGGAGVTIHWAVEQTSLGPLLVAATGKGVCRLAFGEGKAELARRFPKAELVQGGEAFAALVRQVIETVEKPGAEADIPLDVKGTAFQERVWQALKDIPAGETRTYVEIAAAAGNARAVRAAGSANGANPVAVLVPCHRVVRSDGSLGGYAYGPDIKRELLRREREGNRG